MKAWYCYRRPREMKIVAGQSGIVENGFGENGFVIAPFDGNPDSLFTIVPEIRHEYRDWRDFSANIPSPESGFLIPVEPHGAYYPFPEESTPGADHQQEVRNFIRHHLNRGGGKTIAARIKVCENRPDLLRDMFLFFCRTVPNAFVFSFSSPQSGTWFGASPELLLLTGGRYFKTAAIAGTRSASTGGSWDGKNIREQRLVADFIVEKLRAFSLHYDTSETKTLKAGPVEHICTDISGFIPDGITDEPFTLFRQLALSLAPTPALCGDIREESLSLIREHEKFQRGYYGGFSGEALRGDFEMYVNLRSCRLTPQKIALYAGGGITSESDPEAEWIETERKLRTLLNYIEIQ